MKIEVRKPTEQELELSKDWPIWEKEISEFPWGYTEKETCLILEGRATATADSGEEVEFGRGDWVVFEAGLNCVWKVLEPIKKRYNFGEK